MTPERLEELIKQEAEIYVVADNHIFKYKLEKKLRPFIGCNRLWVDVFNIPYDYQLNQIFETKADAEKELERQMWKVKTHTECTERFEPPMWETRIVDHKGYTFTFVLNNDVYVFRANQFKDEIRVSKIAYDGLLFDDRETTLFLAESFTKENYIKACEMVRDLFRGKK